MGVMAAGLLREDMRAASIGHHGIVVPGPTLLALAGATPVSAPGCADRRRGGLRVRGPPRRGLFDADLARRLRPHRLHAPRPARQWPSAHLLGLNEDETVAAVALAVDAASGLNQWPRTGGDEIFFQAGRAAQARRDRRRPGPGRRLRLALDAGRRGAGLFVACGRTAARTSRLFAGEPVILAVYNKALPICNFAQTSSQAALAVAAAGFEAGKVRQLTAFVHRVRPRPIRAATHVGGDDRALQAKMSIRFGVAAALANGDLREATLPRPGRRRGRSAG